MIVECTQRKGERGIERAREKGKADIHIEFVWHPLIRLNVETSIGCVNENYQCKLVYYLFMIIFFSLCMCVLVH